MKTFTPERVLAVENIRSFIFNASLLFNNFSGYRESVQLSTAPLFSCIDRLVPGSALLHVLPIFPTQKRSFFCHGFPVNTDPGEAAAPDVNKMNNLEHLTDRLLFRRRSEEAGEGGKRLKAQGFLLQRLDCFVLPPVIMEDISSKWDFSERRSATRFPLVRVAWPWLQRKASGLHGG